VVVHVAGEAIRIGRAADAAGGIRGASAPSSATAGYNQARAQRSAIQVAGRAVGDRPDVGSTPAPASGRRAREENDLRPAGPASVIAPEPTGDRVDTRLAITADLGKELLAGVDGQGGRDRRPRAARDHAGAGAPVSAHHRDEQ
jgi:hypothetical protein